MVKRRGIRWTIMVMAAALIAAGGNAAAGESAPPAPEYRIVAIGDSLTVGYQPGMTESSVPYGYAERLYEQALFRGSAELDTFGIIGLRAQGLYRLLQGAAEGKKLTAKDIDDFSRYPETARLEALADGVGARTAELREALAAANLVVVTVGSNDFSDFLRQVLPLADKEMETAFARDFDTLLERYVDETAQVLRLTAKHAPDADLYISDLYLPLPQLLAGSKYEFLYAHAVNPITGALEELTSALRDEGIPVQMVPVAKRFKGKEGSMTHVSLSITGEASKLDNHPTDSGYLAIAQAFTEAIWQEEFRKPAARPADVPISVIVSGRELVSDNKPVLKQGFTFIALRDVSDAMGAELLWDGKSQSATFRRNGREVEITIGSKTMKVNGKPLQLAAPAYLHKIGQDAKTYVPLRVIADGLGFQVVYSPNLQAAFINDFIHA